MTLLLLSGFALAADAHYDPDQVAVSSELFLSLATQMGPWYEDLQNQMTRISMALEGLDAATLLVGTRTDSAAGTYAQGLRKQAAHQYLQVQRFADVLAEDTEQTFGQALDRALADLGVDAEPCVASSGSFMEPMQGMGSGPSDCPGQDISMELAQRMDRDPSLRSAVAEIQGLDWPGFAVEGQIQPVIGLTGTERYIMLDAAARALIQDQLDVLEMQLEDQIAPFEDHLTEGAEGGEQALTEAQAFRTSYEAAVAVEGERLLDALTKGLKKQAGVGVCVNPEPLGGCEGNDVTAELLPGLVADKKVLKALR
jgi:hypothetical protein